MCPVCDNSKPYFMHDLHDFLYQIQNDKFSHLVLTSFYELLFCFMLYCKDKFQRILNLYSKNV